jgi:DNA-binding SARP family transcriptional activator
MIKIELMRHDPIVIHEGDPIKIDGVQRGLLRLLVLREGQPVSNDSIARLTESDDPQAAASKVRYLRNNLGPLADIVRNERGAGYSFASSECQIDAIEFRRGVEAILARSFDPFRDRMEPDEALEKVHALDALLKLWRANPALDLPAQEYLEREYEDLYDNATQRLVYAKLFTTNEDRIREAIATLEHIIAIGQGVTSTWRLLLLAYDALGAQTKGSDTLVRIADFYDNKIPVSITLTIDMILSDPNFQNPFQSRLTEAGGRASPDASFNARQDTRGVEEICRVLGITTGSHLSLLKSDLEPAACIRRTVRRLWFSGVMASKWVAEAWLWNEFDQLLTRLDREDGEVRFMMINPHGEGYRRLAALRNGHISTKSIEPISQLVAAHPSMQVRLFDSLPSFRIVIIDDDVVSFSPYRLGADAYLAAERGWEAPHVMLDPLAPYPLAEAFTLLFEETWNNATPLKEIL